MLTVVLEGRLHMVQKSKAFWWSIHNKANPIIPHPSLLPSFRWYQHLRAMRTVLKSPDCYVWQILKWNQAHGTFRGTSIHVPTLPSATWTALSACATTITPLELHIVCITDHFLMQQCGLVCKCAIINSCQLKNYESESDICGAFSEFQRFKLTFRVWLLSRGLSGLDYAHLWTGNMATLFWYGAHFVMQTTHNRQPVAHPRRCSMGCLLSLVNSTYFYLQVLHCMD